MVSEGMTADNSTPPRRFPTMNSGKAFPGILSEGFQLNEILLGLKRTCEPHLPKGG